MATFDAKADTPATAVAAADKFPFGDVSADGWDTITAAKLLEALALVTDDAEAVKDALGITGGGGGGTPGGSDGQVQFNDGGAFGGDARLTFNEGTGVFTAPVVVSNGHTLTTASAVVYGRDHGTVSGTDQYVAGIGNTVTGSDGCIVIGSGCTATARVVFVLGRNSSAAAVSSVAVGNDCIVGSAGQGVALGAAVTVTAGRAMAVGMDVTAGHRGIALGESCATEAGGDVVIGVAGACPFVKLKSNSSTTDGVNVSGVRAAWVDQTHATRAGRIDLGAYSTTTFQPGVRVDANSGGVRLGFYGVAAVARQTLPGAGVVTADDIRAALIALGLCQ